MCIDASINTVCRICMYVCIPCCVKVMKYDDFKELGSEGVVKVDVSLICHVIGTVHKYGQ